MTRQTAVDILTAGLGQMISVESIHAHGATVYRINRLFPNGPMSFREEYLAQANSWYDLVETIFPEIEDHYDSRFDIIEQSYLNTLRNERKAKRIIKETGGSTLLQNNMQPRTESG